jgi:RimJ/RimL family protein N-acetyltransferase
MAWHLTESLEEFTTAADGYLRADPVRHTVPLTVLESLRQRGHSVYGPGAPVFGWHESAPGTTDGAFFQTPPYAVLVAGLPAPATGALLDLLAASDRAPKAFNLPEPAVPDFAAAWTAAGGGTTAEGGRSRLFRLAGLMPPDPAPSGAARVAGEADRDLLVRWNTDFAAEATPGAPGRADGLVSDRLSHGGQTLWEVDGRPVSMAGLTRMVAGVTRVTGVYTPPEHRRRGYGGAATAAVSQQALDAGAAAVVLYTDLANPTSNALYRRLGYRPVEDRVLLRLLQHS